MFHSQSTQVELFFCGCLFLPDHSIMYLSNNFDKKKRKWLLLMQVSTAVLLFSDAFLYCYFDADNFYYRNTGFVIYLLFPVVSMLIDRSLLVQFRKNIRKKIFVSMLSYIYNVKSVR